MIFKENNIVSMYSGELSEFDLLRENLDIRITISDIFSGSIIDFSLGGIMLVEDIDYTLDVDEIRLLDKDDSHLVLNTKITIHKTFDCQVYINQLQNSIDILSTDIENLNINLNQVLITLGEEIDENQSIIESISGDTRIFL